MPRKGRPATIPAMTERLYYLDPYLKEFSARVVRRTERLYRARQAVLSFGPCLLDAGDSVIHAFGTRLKIEPKALGGEHR